MKKIIITALLGLLANALWSQNEKGAKIAPVSQAIQVNGYTLQVGIPYLGETSTTRTTNPLDIRFPWDVLYLYNTFAEESFEVSKGYFGDKILISWTIRANNEAIENFKILRREYSENNTAPFQQIGNVSKYALEFEDKYVEGGVLYEYKVIAEGISSIESEYNTFITGIGYRNPTAIVTGNVSYKGGNPVKDVTIKASSQGSTTNTGSSLHIPATGSLEIDILNRPITTATTLQAWLKPVDPFTTDTEQAIRLFKSNDINVDVNLLASSEALSVKIGNSDYQLKNFYPSGNLDSRGDDIVVPVSDFNTNFVHFSIVINDGNVPLLFINGREINEAYATSINATLDKNNEAYSGPYLELNTPTQTNTITSDWNSIDVGGNRNAYVDEIRVWNTVKKSLKIRTDYRRYIGGNDATLISYIRANEGTGAFAYDLSKNGFDYNKNHGKLYNTSTIETDRISWASGSGNTPTADQLGILGVTDVNGNYEITAIPYSGTGESFNVTPLYGVHQFEPGQQLVFLGQGSEVVNKIDFTDISSFSFKGQILYDTRGVFKSFVETTPTTDNPDYYAASELIGEGYNYYETLSDGKKSKGEYWYNDNGTADEADDFIEKYAKIASEGVNVYIDGNIVLDENNTPVVSDAEGNFDVSVPIGKHYITLKKAGHTFAHSSRFPAEPGEFKEFFEDSNEAVTFIDNTRVTLVGRVVGGLVEAEKVIGFGENGLFEKSITDSNDNATIVTVSSKNNIGVADIAFGYKPGGAAANVNTTFNFNTNSASGEYRVSLLPLNYELQVNDLVIPTATELTILKAAEEIKLSEAVEATIPVYDYENGNSETGMPYHFKKSFTYRSTPVLKVVEQTSDSIVTVNGTTFSTDGFEFPVYSQFVEYKVVLNRFERYLNYDIESEGIESLVPVVDGELLVNNNLALKGEGKETILVDSEDGSILTYTFFGGLPAVSAPFTLSSTLKYRINGIDFDVENYKDSGIILGGKSDGSQTFVTNAPDIPDIILRDPPGSNSFSSIEEGTSLTFTTQSSFEHVEGGKINVKALLGVVFEAGGGLAGPVISVKNENTVDGTIGISNSSKDGKSLTKSYTFNQTISTSNDPEYVGSDGDLYIGNSKNQLYGAYNDIQASISSTDSFDGSVPFELTNSDGKRIFISKQKSVYFVEEPSDTFFVYSQKHILTTLIPEYELFISNIDKGLLTEGENGTLTKEDYLEQIRLWKKVILDNEKSKYLAKNDRDKYKTTLTNVIANFDDDILRAINNSNDPVSESKLREKLNESKKINDRLSSEFEDNFSFDAGVGEFKRSVESSFIDKTSSNYKLSIEEEIKLILGGNVNGVGLVSTTSALFQQNIETSLSEEEKKTTKISYTLKDNDPANLLSVDVVNLFDGNGPVFITQGGRTSCPYEGPEESKFFTNEKFDSYFLKYFAVQNEIDLKKKEIYQNETEYDYLKRRGTSPTNQIAIDENRNARLQLGLENDELIAILGQIEYEFSNDDLDAIDRANLSFATERVENIQLTIEGSNDKSNIPEGRKAEFVLKLENLSSIESSNPSYNYFNLMVENTSNPNNANININPNGTSVYVPYGKPVYYTVTLGKSISDVYDYENIKITLESSCDPNNVNSEVEISAHFIPSCSEVIVNAPLDNWTYNIDEAYNLDGSTKPLKVSMIGFNTDFDSFKKIDLEYRLATSPNWTRLHSYYGNQTFYDEANANGETDISFIATPSLSYAFEISELNLPDGDYEIRARSICSNDTEFISEVIAGKIDLSAPQKFGTPLPTDGVLGAGEDLRVSFNENIFYNQAISTIEIKGQTNQLPINHNVSLHFEGATNTAIINNPKINSGDFALEFWINNNTIASTANIISQEGGLNIGLNDGDMIFSLGDAITKGSVPNDGLFHHYTFTYNNTTGNISIYQDDTEIAGNSGNASMNFTNNNPLVIGGNTFIGNLHDVRLWNKTISLDNAYATMYDKLIGNETNLIGYWPMDEGRGEITKDLARFKHAVINASWDIKPKGTSYEFSNGQYMTLDNVGFVQLTNEMDATISFWMKTAVSQEATLFSNGKGDGTDIVQSNGQANKWAINMTNSGMLTFKSEGKSYLLTNQSIADGNWHHVTLLFNRIGSLSTYIDAAPITSNPIKDISGFSGNKIWIGARGFKDLAGNETVDNAFSGKIDELRVWNTLRNAEQISRDRYNEIDIESIGLLLYAKMNAPATGNDLRYFHSATNESIMSSLASLNNGTENYSNDVPAIKPERDLIKFGVNHVINEDEMILEPVITEWASLEGQTVDITVHRMFDNANNIQQSPVTWTAYVKRNEVSWFAEGYNDIVEIVKNSEEDIPFEITILNKGGQIQPYSITNVPNWLHLETTSGTIAPDSKTIITASIDKELTAGEYLENLLLQTEFGYDEKLQIKVKVLADEPNWTIDPTDFDYSMNVVGRIKVDGIFSEDSYDKIGAFVNGEIRGSVNLIYNASYQEYYAFLTIYSDIAFGDTIEFSIWDASQGKLTKANLGVSNSLNFQENEVLGTLSSPIIFENTNEVEQEISLNQGWSWVSLNVIDPDFSNLNILTQSLNLETSDRILSHSPAQLEAFYKNESTPSKSGWSGSISANGGLTTTKMFKMHLTNEQSLRVNGIQVDISNWNFPIKENWNWLPYPLQSNESIEVALAYFEAKDGDVVKSQDLFAIYDPIVGWNGTLKYMEAGVGYMIKSSSSQTFEYPTYLSRNAKTQTGKSFEMTTIQTKNILLKEFAKYSENMNAVVMLPDGYNELFVYDDNDVLKGHGDTEYVNGKALCFITIYGELPENLVFHIGDGFNRKTTSKSFEFASNKVLGSIANPIILNEVEVFNDVYPNPFSTDLNITIDANEDQAVIIELFTLSGQVVFSKQIKVVKGINKLTIAPRVAIGVYMLSAEMTDKTITVKVIKR